MKTFLATFVLLLPLMSHGFFGTMGRDQCGHQQSSYPVSSNDYNHATNMQIQELENHRRTVETQRSQIESDSLRMQQVLRTYFGAPWCDTMLAHMDNGMDCCPPTTGGIGQVSFSSDRRPAGNDVVQPYYQPPSGETVQPQYPTEVTVPVTTTDTPPASATSCNGYSSQYCSSNWGQTYTQPQTNGRLCLQTGFAATPAWYYGACRAGGTIDPQVCSNSQITRYPGEYQKCMTALDMYRRMTMEKRRLSAQIEEINGRIQALRNPNRPSNTYGANPYADQNYSGGGYNSEVKTSSSGNFLSGLGSFLGDVVTTLGPFVIDQYMSYQAQKQNPSGRVRTPRVVNPGMAGSYGPQQAAQPYMYRPQPPPAYYGPNYGYGFSYGNNYGGTLPGYRTGGLGCSSGILGSGLNLISTLLGGGNARLNMQANLGGNFGAYGGAAPYNAYVMGYGNQYPNVPAHTFPGNTPPYQPGGIYGGVQGPQYYSPQTVTNYYANGPQTYNPVGQTPYTFYQPTPYAPQNNGTMGTNYNSYYYAQNNANNQRLAENEATIRRKQQELDYQLMQLRMMGGSTSATTSNNGVVDYYAAGSFPTVDLNAMMPSMLANPQAAGAQLYMNTTLTTGF